jgi:putative peptidoglycan lipid II flippase
LPGWSAIGRGRCSAPGCGQRLRRAYRIPNYLRRVFAEGSFSSAFVPVLSELRQRRRSGAPRLLGHAPAHAGRGAEYHRAGMLFAPRIARLFLLFAGKDSAQVAMTADMLRITFPYLAFISMTALSGSVLNSFRKFGLPAFTPVLHNLSVIFAMLVLARYFEVPSSLAWGVFLAGLLQLLLLWPALGRLGLRHA